MDKTDMIIWIKKTIDIILNGDESKQMVKMSLSEALDIIKPDWDKPENVYQELSDRKKDFVNKRIDKNTFIHLQIDAL